MKKIILNKNLIFQDQQPSKIIAEISCNHNGKRFIDKAYIKSTRIWG